MSEINKIETIEDALRFAASQGVDIPDEVLMKAQAVSDLRQSQLLTADQSKSKVALLVERFNQFYPRLLEALIAIGDVMISLTQTLLIGVGVPVVLVLLMLVEIQRVFRGMALFEVEPTLAAFGATVLVVCNLVFELLISWREHQDKWPKPEKYRFSLAILGQQLGYLVGWGDKWEPEQKSPALRFKVVLRIITFSILCLALSGSMESVIGKANGNWYQAIVAIFTQSTLSQFVTWAGGLLFAVAAVFSAQALSEYVAEKVIEIIDDLNKKAEGKPNAIVRATVLAGAMALVAYIQEAKRRQRSTANAATMPTQVHTVDLNSVLNKDEQHIHEKSDNFPSSIPDVYLNTSSDLNTDLNSVLNTNKQMRQAEKSQPLGATLKTAVDYLRANPDARSLSLDKLTNLIGVSRSTVNNAKKYLEARNE